jgi:uncharacterized OB-fold protein
MNSSVDQKKQKRNGSEHGLVAVRCTVCGKVLFRVNRQHASRMVAYCSEYSKEKE